MELNGIVETTIYTDDLIAMRQFYENSLGLKCISYTENQSLFFKINRSMLLIFNRAFTINQTARVNGNQIPPHATNGHGHLAFESLKDHYEDRKAEILELGIEIESEVTWPNGKKSFYFRDPSDNSIEIVEYGLWERD